MNKKDDKILRVCLCFFAVVLFVAFVKVKIDEKISDERREEVISKYVQAVSESDYIMHALGSIDGYACTNSKEALEESKKHGARFYEVDVQLTADDRLVLSNGWPEDDRIWDTELDTNLENGVMFYNQFMATRVQGRFTPIDFNYLVEFMKENPNIYVMLDFGNKNTSYLRKAYRGILAVSDEPSVLDRMIVGGYNSGTIGTVRSVYDFKLFNMSWPAEWNRTDERIDTKEEFLDFCKKNKIASLSTSVEVYDSEKETMQYFRDNGLIVYVFTEDDKNRAEELLDGADMVGTNFLYPQVDKL
ncbi:hypothetical protein IKE97_02905 [Candidatus Saccharibacteria bacterium]|nr:hypothetical protein [Candidatus Saccharibacteria bacterium]